MTPQVRTWEQARLDHAEALRYLGYDGQEIDSALLERFNALADACERTLHPRSIHRAFDIVPSPTVAASVTLRDCGLMLEGASIAEHLEGATQAVLLVVTLGIESERELRKYAALSPTDALLFGAAASAYVEAGANAAEAAIVAEASAQGLYVNWRFSPGYGDLPLSLQPAFLKALDATRQLGVTTTDSFMLVPAKSITAIIGLFEQPHPQSGTRVSCAKCQLKDDCLLRGKGTTCHG